MPAEPLRGGHVELGPFEELDLQDPLSARAVEQDLVAVGFPDGGELGRPRSVHAEIDAARFVAPQQGSLRQRKSPLLQLKATANRRVDIFSKIVNGSNLLKTGQHFSFVTPESRVSSGHTQNG